MLSIRIAKPDKRYIDFYMCSGK